MFSPLAFLHHGFVLDIWHSMPTSTRQLLKIILPFFGSFLMFKSRDLIISLK